MNSHNQSEPALEQEVGTEHRKQGTKWAFTNPRRGPVVQVRASCVGKGLIRVQTCPAIYPRECHPLGSTDSNGADTHVHLRSGLRQMFILEAAPQYNFK